MNPKTSNSLARFIRDAWRQILTEPYPPAWHLSAICEHLEAIAKRRPQGKITTTVERGTLGDQLVMDCHTLLITHKDELGTYGRTAYSVGPGHFRCLLWERRGSPGCYIAPMIPRDERPFQGIL